MFSSLLIYGSSFTISLLISYIYQKDGLFPKLKKNASSKTFWAMLIVLPVALVAAFRVEVGTDYSNYIAQYNLINTFNSWTSAVNYTGIEPLYVTLNLFANTIFGTVKGSFFLSSFLIHFLIVKGLMFFEDDLSITYGLFVSLMLHYSFGLNGIRQMIAMAFIFYGYRYIYNKSIIKYLIIVIIAMLFHSSAIIGFSYILFFEWDIKIYNKNIKNVLVFLYSVILITTPILISIGLSSIFEIPVLNQYAKYIDNRFNIGAGALIFVLSFLFPLILFKKNILNKYPKYESIYYLSYLLIPLTIFGAFGETLGRMVLYTETFMYILIPLNISSFKSDKHGAFIYYSIFLLLYYILKYVILGSSETYPYYFSFN